MIFLRSGMYRTGAPERLIAGSFAPGGRQCDPRLCCTDRVLARVGGPDRGLLVFAQSHIRGDRHRDNPWLSASLPPLDRPALREGPRNAVVLGFVSGKHDDLLVPGASYTFRQLSGSQAGGDIAAMAERGQNVMPVRLRDSLVEDPIKNSLLPRNRLSAERGLPSESTK